MALIRKQIEYSKIPKGRVCFTVYCIINEQNRLDNLEPEPGEPMLEIPEPEPILKTMKRSPSL